MAYLNGKKILMKTNVTTAVLPIDQTFNPESENAQSGKAVAQAVADFVGNAEQLKLIKTITLEEDVTDINVTFDKGLKEIFVVMKIGFDQETGGMFCCRTDGGVWYPMRQRFNLPITPHDYFMYAKEQIERLWQTAQPDKPVLRIEANTESALVSALNFTKRPLTIKRFPKDLNFFVQGRAQKITAGSTIEIWGVEADENI